MTRAILCLTFLINCLLTTSGDKAGIITFDIPSSGSSANSTFGNAINNSDVVVGNYNDAANTFTRAFERLGNGTLVYPIVAPGDNSNNTQASGINDAGTIAGTFLTTSGGTQTFHGFTFNGSTFTQYDVGGPFSTAIGGINNNGDLVGTFGSSVQANQGFLKVGNTLSTISIAGATAVFGDALNNLDQVVGQFTDSAGNTHSYFRAADGTITNFDVTGATDTFASGINDLGVIVGTYTLGGVSHGFLDTGGNFTTFDVPGSLGTLIGGINNAGDLTGTYVGSDGVLHGFLTTASVPEPSSLTLVLIGLTGAIGHGARRRRKVASA